MNLIDEIVEYIRFYFDDLDCFVDPHTQMFLMSVGKQDRIRKDIIEIFDKCDKI